jgi:hemoglobin/transferrin/lactoferrin receptor protein
MSRPATLAVAVWLALSCTAQAEENPAASAGKAVNELQRVQVTATRSQRAVADVPNSVDVIDREQLDDRIVRDIRELVRYEPGVAVTSSFGRFGLGGFRIRGLDGNRVRIQTDGIAVSDAFSIGSFSNANRNFVDLDTLKRVEIVRGPTSSLYGSDALGGVVSFVTKDPSDYLAEGKDAYFGFRLGYEGSWEGIFGGATAAFGGERWSGLAAVSHRQGQETENHGDVGGAGAARTEANPQERDGRSLLTKLVFAPGANQRFKLTVEGNEDSTDTDVLSARGDVVSVPGAPPSARVSLQTGDDHQTRARASLSHEVDALDAGFADSLDWQAYRQDSETTQRTRERRATLSGGNETNPALREREFDFDQRTYGLQANLRKSFGDGVRHDLAYGLDLSRTETHQKRDGQATNLTTGAVSKTILPDVFPVRDFPISRTTNAALYAQDEIAFAGGAFRLVPGVRVDRYRLRPQVDDIFAGDNPGVAAAEVAETSVSPKLGMVWRFADAWSLFGGYSRGFRSPPYNDVNIGFTNVQFGYTAIANPGLKPETSDGVELGVRFVGAAAYASVSGYYNRYRDFIESFAFVGFNEDGLMVYQSRNVSAAEIHGAELKAGLDLGALSPAWDGWSLRGAAAWSYGEDRTADAPLDSVDPPTATLGLNYDGERWGAELAGRFAGRKRRVSDPDSYRQPGYAAFDLYAHWNFAPGAKFAVGVLNLADRKYWEAGDMPLASISSAVLDRYTAPGRSVSASLAVEW